MVSPLTLGLSNYAHERVLAAGATSGTFETSNWAAYMPVLVPTGCIIRRLWWANGATVSASYNVDVGVYGDAGYKPGVRLISTGSTAQGTASQVQFVDVTDTALAPGRYWLAITCSSSSATVLRATLPSGGPIDAAIRFQQSLAAHPLPATATPVESSTSTIYLCGFATTASP
jgi:hypothetical protein